MLLATSPTLPGYPNLTHKGLVCGEAIIGAHLGKDILASLTNLVGGRSDSYESTIRETRDEAILELIEAAKNLGANAVIGMKFDYHSFGNGTSMMMVAVSGTAVVAG